MKKIYWFIGQPGSGKTTLARRLKSEFNSKGTPCIHLDGDELRKIFAVPYDKKESFGKEYRIEQTRCLQRFVKHIAEQGIIVIVSTVNPYRDVREEFKKDCNYVTEIYVCTKDTRGREHFHVKDFEYPIEKFHVVQTGNGLTEEEVFKNLYFVL